MKTDERFKDFVSSTLDFNAISRNALSVLNSELAGGITSGKIVSVNADTVTAGTLTRRTVRTSVAALAALRGDDD